MKRFSDLSGHPLAWKQPSWLKSEFELWDGDQRVAVMRFRSEFGTMAAVENSEGSWTFKRVGFFKTRVCIRQAGSEGDIAVFNNDTWKDGGTLVLPDGRSYRLTTNIWQNKYEFQTSAGDPILRMDTKGLFKQSSTFEILAGAADLKELPWMLLLSWYLVKMMELELGMAAVVIG